MVPIMDGDPPNRQIFLCVAFLFGLPPILNKLHTLIICGIALSACFEVWSNVTFSFISSKIKNWHLRLWFSCVFEILLRRSIKFFTWGWSSQTPRCHQLHDSFLLCHLKCYENNHTMTMKEEHLWCYKLHVLYNIFFTFWWFYLDIVLKSTTPHSKMLHWFYLQAPSHPLEPWATYNTPNTYLPINRSLSLILWCT